MLYNKIQISVLNKILKHLSTELYKPEDTVIRYFDDDTDMYLIAKGEVRISIINTKE